MHESCMIATYMRETDIFIIDNYFLNGTTNCLAEHECKIYRVSTLIQFEPGLIIESESVETKR